MNYLMEDKIVMNYKIVAIFLISMFCLIGAVSAADDITTDVLADVDGAVFVDAACDDVDDSLESIVVEEDVGITEESDLEDSADEEVMGQSDSNYCTDLTSKGDTEEVLNDNEGPTTHIVNETSFSDYFDENGFLRDIVKSGDTLDFQGRITVEDGTIANGTNITINIPLNIISSTNDAYIDLNTTAGSLLGTYQGACFVINNEGSYTNVTGIYFHNTQLWLTNTHHVTLDNISAIVEDQRVGSGVGQTSIRDNSTYITVKNSHFYTRNNGGSSTFVLAWADYCTIYNNTYEAAGEVGNLFYLNAYNIRVPHQNVTINTNNRIFNNTIGNPDSISSGGGISLGMVIYGTNNTIDENNFYYGGINSIFGENGKQPNEDTYDTVINNKFYSSGHIQYYTNVIIRNNTFYNDGVLYLDSECDDDEKPSPYIIAENNTVANIIVNNIKGINITGNNISKDLNISDSYSCTFMNNTINGQVHMTRSNENMFKNNTVINNLDYTIKFIRSENNWIVDNFLICTGNLGEDTFELLNNFQENNNPKSQEIIITDSNYDDYFDSNGDLINAQVGNYSTILIQGEFRDKTFKFHDLLLNVVGIESNLYNSQIYVLDNARITFSNLTIMNDESVESSIVVESENVAFENISINHISDKDIKEIIVKKDGFKLENSVISITNNGSADNHVIIFNGTSNNYQVIKNNKISINGGKNSYVLLSLGYSANNTISDNDFNLSNVESAYGIFFNSSNFFNTIENNNMSINSLSDAYAIVFNQSTTDWALIRNNNIDVISKNNAYGIIINNSNNPKPHFNIITYLNMKISSPNIVMVMEDNTNNSRGRSLRMGGYDYGENVITNINFIAKGDNVIGIYALGPQYNLRGEISIDSKNSTALVLNNSNDTIIAFSLISNPNGAAMDLNNVSNTHLDGMKINSKNAVSIANSDSLRIKKCNITVSDDYAIKIVNSSNLRIYENYLTGKSAFVRANEAVNCNNCLNVTFGEACGSGYRNNTPNNEYSINAKSITVKYNTGGGLTVTVYRNGKAIANAKFTIKINGKTLTFKTNSKGQYVYRINLAPKSYKATVAWGNVKKTVTVTVVKDIAKFKSITKKVKINKYFSVKLVSSKNKAIKNQKIVIKVGSKKFTVKTNSKGIAKLKLSKKIVKRGKTYKIAYNLKTNKYYKTSKSKYSVKVKIT